MAPLKKGGGGGGALAAALLLLAAGLSAFTVWIRGEAIREEEGLDRVKAEYREMVDRMKPAVLLYLKGAKTPSNPNEDLLTFLSRKATQAQIPASLFKIQRNQELKTGGWRELSYSVSLQGAKDAPVSRVAVADFIRLVETERPSVRVKNLSLAFAGDNLGQASVTFSAFDRDAAP